MNFETTTSKSQHLVIAIIQDSFMKSKISSPLEDHFHREEDLIVTTCSPKYHLTEVIIIIGSGIYSMTIIFW